MPTLNAATRERRPPIRVRPAPRTDPPYDDELGPQQWVSPHQLAFEFPPRPAPVAPPPDSPPPAQASHGPRVVGASGEARLAVRRFVTMCVEVLNGYRPATHLRWLSLPKEAPAVIAQAVAGTARVAELRRTRGTPRTTDRRGRGPTPVGVVRLHLCEPRPGAVEAAVLLVTGDRTWAMALRLELHHQSWRATTLRLV
jgi:Family of unknown function (DUF6459)